MAAGHMAARWIAVTIVVVCNVQCNEDIVSVINRIDNLNNQIVWLKKDLADVGETVIDQIDSAKISLRLELKQHMSEHVEEAIAGILQGESIEEMVRSQVITEVRQLRRGNHLMKRQLHRVLMSLRDVQEEMNTYKEALEKAPMNAGKSQAYSKYLMDIEKLKRDLEQCKGNMEESKLYTAQKEKDVMEMKQNLVMLNETCQLKLIELSTSTATTQGPSSAFTATSTFEKTSLATTIKPEEERSHVIIAPMWSETQHQFRHLNIDSNTVSTYQLRNLKEVISVAYVSKLRKLLIGLQKPDKILSSVLKSYDAVTMRENVKTFDMTVDEEREIVFLTTDHPRYTISRMTTRGKHFNAITDLANYGPRSRAIAVNSKEKKLFVCNGGKVFTVMYDGRRLQTLATGSNMFAVTLDNTRGILYYNDKKKLMKISLSDNVATNVTTLSVTPWTIRYYRDTVYYSSCCSSTGTIGAVDVGHNIVPYTLQSITMKDSAYFAICLVP